METSDEDSKELGANEMEIGSFIRDTLVPRAVLFFTGEAIENEDYDEELDDEDFDDDDEDDDDGLSSDEEEQDSPRSKGKQGADDDSSWDSDSDDSGSKAAYTDVDPNECQTQ